MASTDYDSKQDKRMPNTKSGLKFGRLTINRVSPDNADALGLINEIIRDVASQYPEKSRHGLNSPELIVENVSFFVIYADGMPVGCGGVKFYCKEFAEIKRLYIRPLYRRQGLGKLMLSHLE